MALAGMGCGNPAQRGKRSRDAEGLRRK